MTSKKHFTYVIGKTSTEMNTDESQQHMLFTSNMNVKICYKTLLPSLYSIIIN